MKAIGSSIRAATLSFLMTLATNVLQGEQLLVPIGSFSAMHESVEHCSGYEVDLWQSTKDRGLIVGLFRACAGTVGEWRTGEVERGHIDPITHVVSFDAVLSLGSVYVGGGRQIPSNDVYKFRGLLRGAELLGSLVHSTPSSRNQIAQAIKIQLMRTKKKLPSFDSLNDFSSKLKHEADTY